MHAEEEIKTQMVDSCQPKDRHAADSLRNSSLSSLHTYLLPFLGLQPATVTSSWVLSSPLALRPSSQHKLPGTHHLPRLTRSLSCHQSHWWCSKYSGGLYSHRSAIASGLRDGPGLSFARLAVALSGMIKIPAPFSMLTVLLKVKE